MQEHPRARPTMAQVAARAGVSVMTVSYAYNRPDRVSEESRKKVLRAASELSYAGPDQSARSLRYGSTRTLGIVLGEHLSYAFDDPQALSFLAGIAEICSDRGYGMLIVPVTGEATDANRVAASAVDAFILWTTTDDDPVLAAVATSGKSVVIHGGPTREGLTPVGIDNRAAARAMGIHLFAHARRPAILSFPVDIARRTMISNGLDPATVRFPVTRERLLGYRDAIEVLGLDWANVPIGVAATNNTAEARTLSDQLLAENKDAGIDAIAAMSDLQALGVLQAAASAEVSVPGHLRVSGWDDSPAAAANALSTVRQDLRAQGASAARLALGNTGEDHTDRWSIITRDSSKHIGARAGGPNSTPPV